MSPHRGEDRLKLGIVCWILYFLNLFQKKILPSIIFTLIPPEIVKDEQCMCGAEM